MPDRAPVKLEKTRIYVDTVDPDVRRVARSQFSRKLGEIEIAVMDNAHGRRHIPQVIAGVGMRGLGHHQIHDIAEDAKHQRLSVQRTARAGPPGRGLRARHERCEA